MAAFGRSTAESRPALITVGGPRLMFSYLSPETMVPQDHPLRVIRPLVNASFDRRGPAVGPLRCALSDGLSVSAKPHRACEGSQRYATRAMRAAHRPTAIRLSKGRQAFAPKLTRSHCGVGPLTVDHRAHGDVFAAARNAGVRMTTLGRLAKARE